MVSGFTSAGVDNTTHIGGLIAGLLIGLVLYRVKLPVKESVQIL